MKIKFSVLVLVALAWLGMLAIAQTSSISYRGRLTAGGVPANGSYDMEFKLFDTANLGAGAQQGDTKGAAAVIVAKGDFTVSLDFGAAVFDGSPRFLEISVRPAGGANPYTTLSPRQQVASVPYSIRSLTADTSATATTLVNGAAVQSLNNLKDNVSLVAGANVTITPNGNTLTIASPTGNSLWSAQNSNAFYNAGNVGIGVSTLTPDIRLEVAGGTLLRPGNGNIQFGSPNAELGFSLITFNGPFGTGRRADVRFDGSTLKLLAGSEQTPPSSASGLAITTDGNVGIGTSTPTAGIRLDVNGAAVVRAGIGNIQLGSPNAEMGLSLIPTEGDTRADLRFNGSVLKLVASTGVLPPSADDGLAVTTAGRVGIGTTAPDAKLHVETTQPGTVVYGHALGTGGVGVYGNAPNPGGIGVLGSAGAGGTAIHADGNATQKLDKGGFVKAMATINPFLPADKYVVRCYNSQPFGNASSTAPCGIKVTRDLAGVYRVDFGFNVEDRFISVTLLGRGRGGVPYAIIDQQFGNFVDLIITDLEDPAENIDSLFHIVVF